MLARCLHVLLKLFSVLLHDSVWWPAKTQWLKNGDPRSVQSVSRSHRVFQNHTVLEGSLPRRSPCAHIRQRVVRSICQGAGDAGSYYQPVLAQSSLGRTFPTDVVHRSVTRSDRVVNSAKGSNPNHRQMWDTRGAQSSLVNLRSACPLRRCSRRPIAGRTNGLCKHYRARHPTGRVA